MLFVTLVGFQAALVNPAHSMGGGKGEEKEEESKADKECSDAKDKRKTKCDDNADGGACKRAKEAKKKACGEESKKEEMVAAAEVEKAPDTSIADNQNKLYVDAHVRKIVEIRDLANSVKGSIQGLHDGLKLAAQDNCIAVAAFATAKDTAISKSQGFKTDADKTLGDSYQLSKDEPINVDLDKASVEKLKQAITKQAALVSEKSRGSASAQQSSADKYAKEADDHLTAIDALNLKMKEQGRTANGTCSSNIKKTTGSKESDLAPFGQ